MKNFGLLLLFAASFALCPMHGQTTTTNTNCSVYDTTANCTSTSTDDSAQKAQQAEQQRQAYETGQAIGAAFGQAMQARAFSKGLRKYCDQHPGEDWHYSSRADGHTISSGHCASDDDKVTALANEFAAHHKDFVRSPANGEAVANYIDVNKLDPRERKSYEKAYKELKKTGQLELYAK
jgi:hypothetical protein